MEKKKEFNFAIHKINLNRSDNLELREKVLRMTITERERLGLTNLHYGTLRKTCQKEKFPKFMRRFLPKSTSKNNSKK